MRSSGILVAAISLLRFTNAALETCAQQCFNNAVDFGNCDLGDANCLCSNINFDTVSCCVYQACSNRQQASNSIEYFTTTCQRFFDLPLAASNFKCNAVNGAAGASGSGSSPSATASSGAATSGRLTSARPLSTSRPALFGTSSAAGGLFGSGTPSTLRTTTSSSSSQGAYYTHSGTFQLATSAPTYGARVPDGFVGEAPTSILGTGASLGLALGIGIGFPLLIAVIVFLFKLCRKGKKTKQPKGTVPSEKSAAGTAATKETAPSSRGTASNGHAGGDVPQDYVLPPVRKASRRDAAGRSLKLPFMWEKEKA